MFAQIRAFDGRQPTEFGDEDKLTYQMVGTTWCKLTAALCHDETISGDTVLTAGYACCTMQDKYRELMQMVREMADDELMVVAVPPALHMFGADVEALEDDCLHSTDEVC